MRERLFRLYVAARNPKYFLWILFAYIACSLYAHLRLGYDGDFGLTNLILSIEASSAGAVLMVVADASAALCERMLGAILEIVKEVRANTEATLAIAEASRDREETLLRLLNNPRVLKALTEGDTQ